MKSILFSLLLVACLSQAFSYECNYTLVESIPEGLNLTDGDAFKIPLTHTSWLELIDSAQHNISIAQFYFSLRCLDVLNETIKSCGPGEQVLEAFERAARRGVQVNIVVNGNSSKMNEDLLKLQTAGAAIQFLNFDELIGAGILHTKFIIVDDSKFYLGSANMDWRSLTQVKEVGIYVNSTCPVLGRDLKKVFSVYWYLSGKNVIPAKLPEEFDTLINLQHPLTIKLNNVLSNVYITSSPFKMNTPRRTNDIDAILDIINSAKRYIKFSVMDYSPTFLYAKNKYWPVIDNALRDAAITRGVNVSIIVGHWKYTRKDTISNLRSLDALRGLKNRGNIRVSLFKTPADEEQSKIPFSRVDHAKFLINEKKGFIGTSNWSADYFVNTGGVSFVQIDFETNPNSIRGQLEQIFDRDWESHYCQPVKDYVYRPNFPRRTTPKPTY